MSTVTFESTGAAVVPIREDDGMTAASSALPRGAYTSLRTYDGGRVLRFEAHLARLRGSVRGGAALDAGRVRTAMAEALASTSGTSRLRVTWAPPRLFVSVEPFTPPPAGLYTRGADCVTLALHRTSPGAKDTAFITTASEHYARLPAGIHEGLMVDEDGSVLEGLSSNVFFVHDGVVRTEETRVLPGVTRGLVLELLAGRLPVVRQALHRDEIAGARECFITSASREVMPVATIDGTLVGHGPGPLARELRAAFTDVVRREAEPL